MSKKLIGLSIIGVVFAFVFSFGAYAQAQQTRVDRDYGILNKDDFNRFGDDRAYNSSRGGHDRDLDASVNNWTPNTYGLMGDYGYDSNGP